MSLEFWDLLDKEGNPTGRIHPRGKSLPKDLYHKCIDVWVYNKEGKILLSKRSSDRPTFPGYWETTGGAVIAGEDSLEAAVRELKEEVGIDIDKDSGILLETHPREWDDDFIYNDLVDVWIFPYDKTVDLSKATTKEVDDLKWVTFDDIKDLKENDKLVDNLEYCFELIEPYIKRKKNEYQ